MNGIFVIVKDKDTVVAQIDNLCEKYSQKKVGSDKQQRAILRNYCHDVISLLNDCFETSLLGAKRCISKVSDFYKSDYTNIDATFLIIYDMLLNLRGITVNSIAFKDLPSCKDLTKLSPEDIVSRANDLTKNDIVKVTTCIILLGKTVCDAINIMDIRNFYKQNLEELEKEIVEKNGDVSFMEKFLISKFKAELGYCHIAMFKAGIGGLKEIKTLADMAHKDIKEHKDFLNSNISMDKANTTLVTGTVIM